MSSRKTMGSINQDIQDHKSRSRLIKITILAVLFCAFFGITGGIAYWTLSDLPKVNALEEYVPAEASRVYSMDGKLLAEFYFERRIFIPYYKIPDHVKKAFVSIEDVRFYSHPGVDFIGILRALLHDIKSRSMAQGGSTITQQLAKMLFLKPEKSLKRKLKEVVLSIQLERRYTKDEILGLYLNQTYFGSRAFGIEAASQTYFGKSTGSLTIGEAALLATLPKAPSQYSPFKNPEKSLQRRAIVLKGMLKNGFISSAEHELAMNEPLPEAPHFRKYDAPYFVELLRQQLEQKFGDSLYTAGYKVHSTVDSQLQTSAEKALINGVKTIEKRVKPGIQSALVAIDNRTGHIKAMVGGFDFWKNQFNRATQALRQTGSAFKPFVYVTAFQQGMKSTDTILDAPISFKGGKPGQVWTPKNYDGTYNGTVTLKTALAKSLNAATVRLANSMDIKEVIETAKSLGITSQLQPYLPTALGASDVTLLEMVRAFSTFSSGKLPAVIVYDRIENRDSILIEEVFPSSSQVLDAEVVDELKILLSAVVTEGTAVRAKSLGRTVYGKTGTTNDYTDAWFIGFDERYTVGVWVGRDNHKPIGNKETGSAAALPIWIDFMKSVEMPQHAAK